MGDAGCQGMPVSNHKAAPAEQRRNEARLRKIVVNDNARCADCGLQIEFRNAWASINLGTFCCIQCSGVHRSLGTHLSKVRAVAADDWNDDWVDNMQRWGNAKANGFWEARPPLMRPQGVLGEAASRQVADFIRAKYDHRVFAAAGEPADWRVLLPLANGWYRHIDEESGEWYYSHAETGETSWELPQTAALPPPEPPQWWPGHSGWLEKKSGGKDGAAKSKLLQKWDRRYFVLGTNGSTLSYYKSDEAYRKREDALGTVVCTGARLFLKEVQKGEVYRFTIVSAERELKLRGPRSEYEQWGAVLRPIVGDVCTDGGAQLDEDD